MVLFQRPTASVAKRHRNVNRNRDRMPRMSMRTMRSKKYGFSFDQRRLILILTICLASFAAVVFVMWIMYNMAGQVSSAHHNVGPHGAKERQKALRTSSLSAGSDVASQASPGEERQCRPTRSEPNTTWKSPPKVNLRMNYRYKQCLQFTCEREDYGRCDTTGPTNYDGPDPPCCVHILRDMAKAFDDVMCELGLEYFSSYGTLLGVFRSERLIPWTGDNDFIVPRETMPLLTRLSKEERKVLAKHGIDVLWDNYNHRVCITPTFADGKLTKSWRTQIDGWYPIHVPFSDIIVSHEEDGLLVDEFGCAHPIDNFRPASRVGVYDNSFHVSVPRDPEAVLGNMFGPEWKTPDEEKNRHQTPKCLDMRMDKRPERTNGYAGGGDANTQEEIDAIAAAAKKSEKEAELAQSNYESETAKYSAILKTKQDELKSVMSMAKMHRDMGNDIKAKENLAVVESVLKEIRETESKLSDLKNDQGSKSE